MKLNGECRPRRRCRGNIDPLNTIFSTIVLVCFVHSCVHFLVPSCPPLHICTRVRILPPWLASCYDATGGAICAFHLFFLSLKLLQGAIFVRAITPHYLAYESRFSMLFAILWEVVVILAFICISSRFEVQFTLRHAMCRSRI